MLDKIKFMEREPTELEKMSLAELIIHLTMKGYKINFHRLGNDINDCKVLIIEVQKEFLGNYYSKNTFIDHEILDIVTLSCEDVIKTNILRAVSAFDKYNEIKKKVTT